MAKKKELPKAMMGKAIKTVIRGAKSINEGMKAAKTSYKASKPASTVKKSFSDWASTGKPVSDKGAAATTTAVKTPEKVKISNKAKATGIAVGTVAAAAGIYGKTKKHRSLK
jgi:hypothetical protein